MSTAVAPYEIEPAALVVFSKFPMRSLRCHCADPQVKLKIASRFVLFTTVSADRVQAAFISVPSRFMARVQIVICHLQPKLSGVLGVG
jgi:hypothetical protein